MPSRSIPRFALLCALPATLYACNVYTYDLLRGSVEADPASGGTGGDADPVEETGGRPSTGGVGGATGGTRPGSGGAATTGGETATGGTTGGAMGGTGAGVGSGGVVAIGGLETAGAPSGGGATGGDAPAGAPSGGASTGGVAIGGTAGTGEAGRAGGGVSAGGAPEGGGTAGVASSGGVPGGAGPTGGTSTGGTPTGGTSTGGAATGGADSGVLPDGTIVIDLLDAVNDTIELRDGQGNWYVFQDGSSGGVITPDPSLPLVPVALDTPRDESTLGVHVVANSGFAAWGAGVGFNLNAPNLDARAKYDVSPYTGVVFFGRSGGGDRSLRVKLVTADIAPTTDSGGECTADCEDAFGFAITLTDAWQEFTVPFSELTQQGWGMSPPNGFDPTGVLTLQLHVEAGQAFDIWLDDVRFYL